MYVVVVLEFDLIVDFSIYYVLNKVRII